MASPATSAHSKRPLIILSIISIGLFVLYLLYSVTFDAPFVPPQSLPKPHAETHHGEILIKPRDERPVRPTNDWKSDLANNFGKATKTKQSIKNGKKQKETQTQMQTPAATVIPPQTFNYYDPSTLLFDFHKSFTPSDASLRPAESEMNSISSANYIMKKRKSFPSGDEPRFATPSKKNVAFAIIYGDSHVTLDEKQDLFLGAIKTFRDPHRGKWMGSIILVTDRPLFIRKLLKENHEWLQCDPEKYDKIPSKYLEPGEALDDLDDGGNACRISILYQPAEPDHPLEYKWTKSKMLRILEQENRERAKDKLPILDYIFYRDADIWSWADTQSLIDYLEKNYRGEDCLLWPQPGAHLNSRGEVLHGGIWMLHREISFYWLRTWSVFMTMTTLGGQSRDQVSLSMIAFANNWEWKLSNDVRRNRAYATDMHIMKFDELYPLDMKIEKEWRNGVFLHWTGRKTYRDDSRAYGICSADIELDKVIHSKYEGEDDNAPVFDVDHSGIHLRDAWGRPMDVAIPVSKVDCTTKQTIMHAYHNLRPRNLYVFVPDLSDCGETFYFAPNIFCYTYGGTLAFGYLREEAYKGIVDAFGGETSILRRLVVPLHIALLDAEIAQSYAWTNQMLSENFVLLEEGIIILDKGSQIYDQMAYAPFLREALPEESLFLSDSLGGEVPARITSGMTVINKKHIDSMVRRITEIHKMETFSLSKYVKVVSDWRAANPGKQMPNDPLGALYSTFMVQQGEESTFVHGWKNISFDESNSKEMNLGQKLKGKCVTKAFMEQVFNEGNKMIKVI